LCRKIGDARLREKGAKTVEIYTKEGRIDELHDIIQECKSRGFNRTMEVYDKAGNLIPLGNITPRAKFNKKVTNELCARISQGENLRTLCKLPEFPNHSTIRKWYHQFPEFKKALDAAYTDRADYYVDQLYELMDEVKSDSLGVKQADFIATQIKWIAERLHPKFMAKTAKSDINVQVNDDGKVNFQILLSDERPTEKIHATTQENPYFQSDPKLAIPDATYEESE
jgi:hypothetical protein